LPAGPRPPARAAAELRVRGLSYVEIGRRLGVTVDAARSLLERATGPRRLAHLDLCSARCQRAIARSEFRGDDLNHEEARSLRLLRGLSALAAEPADDIVLASPEPAGRVQGGSLGVVRNPIQVGSPIEQQLRCPALAGGASVPEGLRQCFGLGAGLTPEQLFKAFEHAEGGSVPELVYLGTSLHEEASDMPARIADGIVKRGAD
jgi:hypothetical protein